MINLVHPRSPFLVNEGMMPPLGIMYLSAVLNRAGIEAQVMDLGVGDPLPDGDLYVTATAAQKDEIFKLPRSGYMVLGGPLASTEPEEMLQHFDCVVCGEAEEDIKAIVTLKPRGIIQAIAAGHADHIPFPDRRLCSKYRYEINGVRATVMITARGCAHRCAFCCRTGQRVRLRSAANVLAEVDQIMQLGYGAICFYDDTIAISRTRLLEICHGLQERKIVWRCMLRSDQTDPMLLRAMGLSGCYEVIFGIESGSQRILEGIRKSESVAGNMEAILAAKRAGIKVKASIVVGLPGESWVTVRETIQFLRDAKPDFLDCNILSVYPGSDIHANPDRYDLKFREATFFKGREGEVRSTVSTSSLTEADIEKARLMIKTEFEGLARS